MHHAGKWREVGLADPVDRADQADRLGSGKGGGELHASQKFHLLNFLYGDGFHFQKVRTEERPPSGRRIWPVRNLEWSESRNATIWATSFASPTRWSG